MAKRRKRKRKSSRSSGGKAVGAIGALIKLILIIGLIKAILDFIKQHIIIFFVIGVFLIIAYKLVKKFKLERIYKYYNTQEELCHIDSMDGVRFERWCGTLLVQNGFHDIQYTPKSGDQGADIIAFRNGIRYAIQCKRYMGNVGNRAVQEATAAAFFYGCSAAIVMTNSFLRKVHILWQMQLV